MSLEGSEQAPQLPPVVVVNDYLTSWIAQVGVVAALRSSFITPEQAYDDLFNLDGYQSIKKHRLSRELKDLFEWGMELEDVAEIAPEGMEESCQAIEKLAQQVLSKSKRKEQ